MTDFCTQCPNNCPADDLQCGKGRRYFEELNGEKQPENEGFILSDEDRDDLQDGHFRHGGPHGHDRQEHDSYERSMHDGGPHGHDRHGHGRQEHGAFERGMHDHGPHDNGAHDHGLHGNGMRGHGPHEHDREPNEHDGPGRIARRMTKEQIEQTQDPEILLRACGHELHHGRRNSADSQQRILGILAQAAEDGHTVVSQRRLQEMLHIQPGSMSEILTKLENKGFIRRERDEEDKRRVGIRLLGAPDKTAAEDETEAGQTDGHHGTAFDVLSDEEKDSLVIILRKLLIGWL